MKLFCPKDDVRGQKVLATAAFADLKVKTPAFVVGKDDKAESFKQMSPLGRVPVLETEQGYCLFESNAICRHIARMRSDKFLYGETLQQRAEVDMWLDFCQNEVEVPALAWIADNAVEAKAKADLTNALKVLDSHLKLRTYMVSERITVADICLCVILTHCKAKKGSQLGCCSFPEVTRWMETVCHQKAFKAAVPSCCKGDSAAAAAPAAAQQKPKSSSKPAESGEAGDAEAPPPKPKCDLDLLPPSPLDINEWKRQYSNTKDLRGKAMPWLWQHFDDKGYCFYYMKYDKLDGECTVPFVTANQLGGFLQRIDNNFRKYSFGVINVVGKDSNYDIQGVWMFRGLEIPQMMKEHPSFEYNQWTRLDRNNPKDKALIEDYFCNEDEVENRPITDCKVWK